MSSFSIKKDDSIALIGASTDPNKYGYKILQYLLDNQYEVYPINPKAKEILKHKVYVSLEHINHKIDIVVFVVPPQVTNEILKQVKQLNIKKVWFQPGSSNEMSLDFCKEYKIDYVNQACLMLRKID